VTRYLLDTSIVSDLVRNPQGKVAAHIGQIGEKNVATSIVVAAELRFGAEKKGSSRLTAQVTAILSALEVAPLEAPADETYGRIRAALENVARPIGANDLLIAAHAIALNATLVTDNEHEFQRIPGLRIVNWLRA
jgi:tRNA(fMet)-specific endonuclease VapC